MSLLGGDEAIGVSDWSPCFSTPTWWLPYGFVCRKMWWHFHSYWNSISYYSIILSFWLAAMSPRCLYLLPSPSIASSATLSLTLVPSSPQWISASITIPTSSASFHCFEPSLSVISTHFSIYRTSYSAYPNITWNPQLLSASWRMRHLVTAWVLFAYQNRIGTICLRVS